MKSNKDLTLVAQEIRRLRELNNLTREQFCADLDYDVNYWGAIERGERLINLSKLIEVSEYFNVSVDKLIGFNKEKEEITQEQIDTIIKKLHKCTPTQLLVFNEMIDTLLKHIK